MQDFGRWIDAHSHLADPRWTSGVDDALRDAREKGIGFFMQGGVGPEDWQAQIQLRQRFPAEIGLCFGLHPYWVAAHDEDECEQALDQLAPLMPQAMALGETGLDERPHIMKDSADRQLSCFEQQLQLAEACGKPVVLHLVQAHDQAMQVFNVWGVPPQGGMVHSFNGSAPQAQDFLRRGLYLSVGGPVCRPDNKRLHQAVRECPLEFLLIETDSPDQPPPAFQGQLNPPASLWEVARGVGELKKMTPTEILDITAANFRRLFQT